MSATPASRPPATPPRYGATPGPLPALTLPLALARSLSTSSSLSSADHKPLIRERQYAPIDHVSLLVIYTLTVVAEAARGLLLPSTWPYFESLGGSKAMLGALIAVYSLGRMLSTTPLGYLSDSVSAASVMNAASVLQAVGHLLYAIAPATSWLYVARALVGFGSATTSVARAHITKAIPSHIRTQHFAYLSGLQFVGIAVLPAFGGLMSFLPEYKLAPFVTFNGFTYPAYLLCFANLACVYLIQRFYTDPPTFVSPSCSNTALPAVGSPVTSSSELSDDSSDESDAFTPTPDVFALVMCLLINLVFRGVLAELETVSIPFLMEQFAITYTVASIVMSAIGALGVCMYFSFRPIAQAFSDRALVVIGLVFIAAGCLPLSFGPLVQRLDIFAYAVFLAFTWSVAYPIGQTAILSLYSKVLTGLSVGGLMGLFSTSGAVSPLVLSIVASNLWDTFGRESVFVFIIAIVLVAMVLLSFSYKRLVAPSLPF